jgi:stage V sporulation protein G
VEITEVRIKLMEEASERLQAFCSITFDNSFVIRDLKIIDGANGPFVAMPSRKLTAHCPACGCKNHLRAAHCNQCGGRLSDDRLVKDEDGRAKLYADIAHPINSPCREMIQQRVIREYQSELDRSKLPGYRSKYDDYDHDVEIPPADADAREPKEREAATRTTQVQPAEPQPRSPHKAPSRQTVPHASHSGPAQQGSTRDNFGAGIF